MIRATVDRYVIPDLAPRLVPHRLCRSLTIIHFTNGNVLLAPDDD